MALNTITIEFQLCEPMPANGFLVSYRPVGSDEDYRTAGPFMSSPAVINDSDDLFGTSYEGIIQGDCGGGVLGVAVPWTANNNESESESQSESASQSASASESVGGECIPLEVGLGNTEGEACLDNTTVYIQNPPDGAIATGAILYTDCTFETPIVGFLFVRDPGGTLYDLNDGTGVVGDPTGNSC